MTSSRCASKGRIVARTSPTLPGMAARPRRTASSRHPQTTSLTSSTISSSPWPRSTSGSEVAAHASRDVKRGEDHVDDLDADERDDDSPQAENEEVLPQER